MLDITISSSADSEVSEFSLCDSLSVDSLISYWTTAATYDYRTMTVLFRNKQYAYSLFFGHLLLEKILKACYVAEKQSSSPFTHSLLGIAMELSCFPMSPQNMNLLKVVTEFNIKARYPDIKYRFYKRCTKSYTSKYYRLICCFYRTLCRKLKQKKLSDSI